MGILDILLGGRGGQSAGGGGSASKIGMALIALMLWRWYQSRNSGGAEAPIPSPRGPARIPSEPPARVPQSAPAQVPSPNSGGDGDSDFGPLANPGNMRIPGGGRSRPMDDDGGMDGGGGGSLNDILNDILRGGGRGMPMPRGDGGRGDGGRGDGGLGDILGDILGGGRGMPGQRFAGGGQGDPLSDLLQSAGIGGLGGLLAGGASGGMLGDLIKQFDQSGQGDAARSWVSSGENVPVTPKQIESTFGSDIIDQIAQQFGMDKSELLNGLSQELPKVVDQLTPDGRLPTEHELSRRG